MIRPPPAATTRQQHTPNSTSSTTLTETLGAFGEVDHPAYIQPRNGILKSTYQQLPQPERPSTLLNGRPYSQMSQQARYSRAGTAQPAAQLYPSTHAYPNRQPSGNRAEVVYAPTVTSSDAQKTLQDVISNADDTVELARNLGDYVNEKIPVSLSVCVLSVFGLISFVFVLIGAFNIPFCSIQPMIPIWLMVAGCLFIVSAILRIYGVIPEPAHKRRQNNSGKLCFHVLELIFIVANLVWLILGCVWVYSTRDRVHFEEGMFEEHYCEWGLYWTAFVACTASLVLLILLIIGVIVMLTCGAMKEEERNRRGDDLPM